MLTNNTSNSNDKDITTLMSTIHNHWIIIPKDQEEWFKRLVLQCLYVGNFIVFPIKKITRVSNVMNKETSRECYLINTEWYLQKIEIDWNMLSNQGKFDELLMNYEWYYITKKGTWFSLHSMKVNIRYQKQLIDFISLHTDLVETRTKYDKVWYINDTNIVYWNGILDLWTKKFSVEETYTDFTHKLMFNTSSLQYSSMEWLIGLWITLDKIITHPLLNFLIKGYLVSSIFKNEIFTFMWSFPLLYVSWIRWWGKTFLFWLLKRIVGFQDDGTTSLWWATSFAIQTQLREMNYYNFIDECQRMDSKMIEIIKWNYDRHRVKKWGFVRKWSIGVLESQNDSTLFLWWESIVGEEALQQRCIVCTLNKDNITHLTYKERDDIIEKWNVFFQSIVTNKQDIDIKKILEQWELIIESCNLTIEKRVKNNLLIIVCGNLILNDQLDEWEIKKLINEYVVNNNGIEETISYNIVEDIVNNFSSYSSILEYDKNGKSPFINIYNNKLFLNIRWIINQYRLKNRENINVGMIQSQFCSLLWIQGSNLKDQYSRLYLYDKTPKDLLAIPLSDVQNNEYLKRIWNHCIIQIKKDYKIININIDKYVQDKDSSFDKNGDYIGRDLNTEQKNKVSNYHKMSWYLEKIFVDHHELYHFRVDMVQTLQEILRRETNHLISIKKNNNEGTYPILLHNLDDWRIYVDIERLVNFFVSKYKELNEDKIRELLFQEIEVWQWPISLPWISGVTESWYYKIKKLSWVFDTEIIPTDISSLLVLEYYTDKNKFYGIYDSEKNEIESNYLDQHCICLFNIKHVWLQEEQQLDNETVITVPQKVIEYEKLLQEPENIVLEDEVIWEGLPF